jgi:hypothetical protein
MTKQKECFKREIASRTRSNFASTQKRQMADISNLKIQLQETTEMKNEIRALHTEIDQLKKRNDAYESKIGDLIELIVWGSKTTTDQAAHDKVIWEALRKLRNPPGSPASQPVRLHPTGGLVCSQFASTYDATTSQHIHTPPSLAALQANRNRAAIQNADGSRK